MSKFKKFYTIAAFDMLGMNSYALKIPVETYTSLIKEVNFNQHSSSQNKIDNLLKRLRLKEDVLQLIK